MFTIATSCGISAATVPHCVSTAPLLPPHRIPDCWRERRLPPAARRAQAYRAPATSGATELPIVLQRHFLNQFQLTSSPMAAAASCSVASVTDSLSGSDCDCSASATPAQSIRSRPVFRAPKTAKSVQQTLCWGYQRPQSPPRNRLSQGFRKLLLFRVEITETQ